LDILGYNNITPSEFQRCYHNTQSRRDDIIITQTLSLRFTKPRRGDIIKCHTFGVFWVCLDILGYNNITPSEFQRCYHNTQSRRDDIIITQTRLLRFTKPRRGDIFINTIRTNIFRHTLHNIFSTNQYILL